MKKNSKRNVLRIAMLGHKRIPSREGGIEVVIEELGTRMTELGHEVTCYNRRGHHVSGKQYDSGKMRDYKGIRLKNVTSVDFRGLSAVAASFFGAVRCALGNYDVVHFHAEGTCAMLWLPKLFGKRCIATIHGLDHQRAKWGFFARKYILAGEKCAVRYADEIIVLSRNHQNYFKDTYGRDVNLIPNGVKQPAKRVADIIVRKFGLDKDNYILFLGRIVPEKGLCYLIEAFQNVITSKKMVIAGGSSNTDLYMAELRKAAAIDSRIQFTGFVQGSVLEELYSNAYVYTLPSDLEGMPLSLLEAMSYGNCCLVSDIPECTEVVEDHAVVFRKGDIGDLTRKLQFLCDNPYKVEEYRENAEEFICRKYNWDDVVARTLQLYRQGGYMLGEEESGTVWSPHAKEKITGAIRQ